MTDSDDTVAERHAVTEDQIQLDGSQWDAQEEQATAEREYVESIGADGNQENLKAAEKRLAAAREQRGEGPADDADIPGTPGEQKSGEELAGPRAFGPEGESGADSVTSQPDPQPSEQTDTDRPSDG